MKRRIVGIALFCSVLLAAIFAGYWDMLNTEKVRIASEKSASEAEVAGAPAAPDSAPVPAAPAVSSGTETASPGTTSPPDAASTASQTPTFDILRVDPDGSTVMAGKAAAGATVRLTDGKTILGEEKAGPGGDFAIILDNPLPVGEHQIKIEANGRDGTAATSRETAIVSVPERGRENELLAMVETPDQPSRLISVPTGDAASATAASQAAMPETAGSDGSTEPSTAKPGEAPGAASQPNAVSAEQPTPPSTPATSAPAPAPASTSRSSNLVAEGALAVEAVEIEDETIYVAGRAPAGPTIRVYVDNVFLAEDAGRKTDRFLVSTKSAIPSGSHMVRADQVAPDGSVLARVEVPFIKPEGRSMSAIAGAPDADPAAAEASEEAAGTGTSDALSGNGAASNMPGTTDPAASGTPQPSVAAAAPDGTSGASTAGSAATGTGGASRDAGGLDPAQPDETAPQHMETEPLQAGAPSIVDPARPAAGSDLAAARQAPLQASPARVIIRRGDTLWRISREVYGRGARYTTIYLANGDQIRNPDRIYPGQVFRMPETAAQ